MKTKRKKAAVGAATKKNITQPRKSYPQKQSVSIDNIRAERIRKHRSDIPKIYRRTYDRAMQGKSHKSAVKAFCLECCGWQKEEVRHCTSLACSLYPYRPYKERQNHTSQGLCFSTESQNSRREGSNGWMTGKCNE